jgi:tRNA pseudouridine55 synthase
VSRKRYPRRPELAGILNLNKPMGMTSHDVVAQIRRAARVRRVGHAGTLDPLATGVLLICLDQATRVARYLMASDKRYRARIRLGATTDTDDREGRVIRQSPIPATLNESSLNSALHRFVGQIAQIPPRFAAIKHKGTPLYELARQGIEVKIEPRPVTIHAIRLLSWQIPELTVEVHCGPGTYIRALARDLGEALGCGAHLTGLVRTHSGRFSIEEAVEPDEVLDRLRGHPDRKIDDLLWPVDAALTHLDAFTINADAEAQIRHGQQIQGPPPQPSNDDPALRRVYADDGTFVAIAEYDSTTERWQPKTVFDLRTRAALSRSPTVSDRGEDISAGSPTVSDRGERNSVRRTLPNSENLR